MIKFPRRTKFRKYQKGVVGGLASNTSKLEFGRYGILSLESGRISAKTLEAARRVISRTLKRNGQIWIRVFPDIPVSTKPLEVRMGKGKGNLSSWICRVDGGQILFEIDGISPSLAYQAALLVDFKLPVKCRLISQ